MRSRRAVISGVGVVAPNGFGVQDYWQATLRGSTGLRRRESVDVNAVDRPVPRVAGEILDFDPNDYLPSRMVIQTDRTTQFALVAASESFRDAGIDPEQIDPESAGVVTASSSGGLEYGQRELQHLWQQGPRAVSAYMSYAWFYAVNSGQLSIYNNLRSVTGVLVSDQAGGIDALGQARRVVEAGTEIVLTGGTDASLCPYGWAAHRSSCRISLNTDPIGAYVPFDERATGYVPGEGGAILVLESIEAAYCRRFPKPILVSGYAAGFDPNPESPRGMRHVICGAIADAGLDPGDIDAIFADAAGILKEDAAEAEAICSVFGAFAIPVTAPKVLNGRLFSGGSSLDLATAVLALREGVLPHTPGVHINEGYGIDLIVDRPREWAGRHVLVLARGRGGFHSAVVLTRPDDAIARSDATP